MLLIDQAGRRVRPICRECRKIHDPKDCPLSAKRRRLRRWPIYPEPVTLRTLKAFKLA